MDVTEFGIIQYYIGGNVCPSLLPLPTESTVFGPPAKIAHLNFAHFDLPLFLLSSGPALTTSLDHSEYIPLLKPVLNAFLTRRSSPISDVIKKIDNKKNE